MILQFFSFMCYKVYTYLPKNECLVFVNEIYPFHYFMPAESLCCVLEQDTVFVA